MAEIIAAIGVFMLIALFIAGLSWHCQQYYNGYGRPVAKLLRKAETTGVLTDNELTEVFAWIADDAPGFIAHNGYVDWSEMH